MKLLRRLRETRLVYKLVLVNILLIILPIGAVGIMSYSRLERQLKSQFIDDSKADLQQRVSAVSEKVAGIESFSANINYGLYLSSFLTSRFENTPDKVSEYQVIINYINSLIGSNKLLQNCSIYYLNETIPEHWKLFYHVSRLDPSYLSEYGLDKANAGWFSGGNTQLKGIKFNPTYFYSGNEMVFIQPIYSKASNALLGFLKAGVARDGLFSSLTPAEGDDVVCLVLDRNGNTIHDPSGSYQAMEPLVRGMQSNVWLGKDAIIVSREIPQLGVTVFLQKSMGTVLRDIADAGNALLVSILLSVFAASAVVWLLVSFLMRRMNRVMASMRLVSAGDFSHRAETNVMDEAGVLAGTLNYMLDNVRELQDAVLNRERSLKNAEIHALQSQINPHFIYNTLERFKIRLEENNEPVIAGALLSLSRMLRYSTKWSQESRLQDELEHLEHYIRLQKIILEGRVNLFVQCDRAHLLCRTPKMMLQPLVENSIVHGLKGKAVVNITVLINRQGDDLTIEVFDDGGGLEPDRRDEVNRELARGPETAGGEQKGLRLTSIGISNINDRLRLMYGEGYGISLDSETGLYTKVTVRLPYLAQME